MSENLQPHLPVISEWLRSATQLLRESDIPSARLDAEIILAHTLRKSRTYLHAHDDDKLDERQLEIADARIRLRQDRTPIAYIVGHKEFYGRLFKVTPATLIPRPESETILELLKKYLTQQAILPARKRLIDVGTGSGCLGISAKLEFPELDVTLADISRHALVVAQENARLLDADITVLRSDLLRDYPFTADIILANLPYIDPSWDRSPETRYEPSSALFAENKGLHLMFRLLEQTDTQLVNGGIILLEADPRQHNALIKKAKNHGLKQLEIRDFIVCLQKI